MTNQTMRALVQRSHAGPDDLVLVHDAVRPSPSHGELLLRVVVAGLNFADVMQSQGRYGGGPDAPYVAGFEVVGEVVDVGPDVARSWVGRRVVGAGAGAFAEHVVVPAAGAVSVPDGWSAPEALGLVLNAVTALAALDLAGIGRDDTVLVQAAAGGVGQHAVRFARHRGATVVATASAAKHDVVRRLGADHVLDSRRPDLTDEVLRLVGPVDGVVESVGRATFEASLAVTRRYTGTVVVLGAASGDATLTSHDLVFRHPVRVAGLHVGSFAEQAPEHYARLLHELDRLAAAGVLPPGRPTIHPLAEGPRALGALAAGGTVGKHALDPWR